MFYLQVNALSKHTHDAEKNNKRRSTFWFNRAFAMPAVLKQKIGEKLSFCHILRSARLTSTTSLNFVDNPVKDKMSLTHDIIVSESENLREENFSKLAVSRHNGMYKS